MGVENPAETVADEDDEYREFFRKRRQRRYSAYLTLTALAAAILLFALWDRIIITVHSGESGVLYRWFTGTDMDTIYGEGLHIIWPWDRMYVYNVRLQTQERSYQLLTNTGLPVDLKVAIRYRPDIRLLPRMHVTVGQDYLNKVVFPETEAVLRKAVGQYGPEEVYTSKRGFLESIVINSLTSVEDRYILVDDVLLRAVNLPPMVRDAIERKLTLKEEYKAYEFRLQIAEREAQRKAIEAGGIKAYQDIIKRSLTADLLRWQGIQATRDLATAPNAKTVVIGAGENGLPLILGSDR